MGTRDGGDKAGSGGENRLVYSTSLGDLRHVKPGTGTGGGTDPRTPPKTPVPAAGVRVGIERKGRGGKTVTHVSGLARNMLEPVCRQLKTALGTGGTVEGDRVIFQGDQRDRVVALLQAKGHKAKAV